MMTLRLDHSTEVVLREPVKAKGVSLNDAIERAINELPARLRGGHVPGQRRPCRARLVGLLVTAVASSAMAGCTPGRLGNVGVGHDSAGRLVAVISSCGNVPRLLAIRENGGAASFDAEWVYDGPAAAGAYTVDLESPSGGWRACSPLHSSRPTPVSSQCSRRGGMARRSPILTRCTSTSTTSPW